MKLVHKLAHLHLKIKKSIVILMRLFKKIKKEKANNLGREVSETEIENLKAEHPEKFKEILNLYKVFK